MKFLKKLFIIFSSMILGLSSYANEIQVDNFEELMNSNPSNGDVIEFTGDLDSSESIGRRFFDIDITFEGHNHYLDGSDAYGGFILSQDSDFNEVDIRNCKGQEYQGSDFAGAIFNFNGNMNIDNSVFSHNFADAEGVNFAIGGAVYNLNDGDINISSTIFRNNFSSGASASGGAVANGFSPSDNPDMSLDNVVFENNYAHGTVTSQGGALFNKGSVEINNTLFKDNYTKSGDNALSFLYGGAIDNAGNMTINNSILSGKYSSGTTNQYI